MKEPAVFISYSTQDQTIAGMVCQALEQEHISCWIAPRNVPVGEKAFEAIPRGVAGCTVLVLILSEKAMQSEYVQRELQLALDYKKVIIPFRIEDIKLDGAVHFMLTGVQWLDAFVPPLERHVASLVSRVAGILDVEKVNGAVTDSIQIPVKKKQVSMALIAVLSGAAVIVICLIAYFGINRASDTSIHAAVVQRLQTALNPQGVLIDCANCTASQAHVDVQVSGGNAVIDGVVTPAEQSLARAVPLDVRGLHSVTWSLADLAAAVPNPTPAPTASPQSAPSASIPASRVSATKSDKTTTPESAGAPAPAHELTAEEYRAKAAVLTGQRKMQEQDYVAAENYFRLALNLDPDNRSARSGLESARKALGEN